MILTVALILIGVCFMTKFKRKPKLSHGSFGFRTIGLEKDSYAIHRESGKKFLIGSTYPSLDCISLYNYDSKNNYKTEVTYKVFARDYICIDLSTFYYKKIKINMNELDFSSFCKNIIQPIFIISKQEEVWNSCSYTIDTIISNLALLAEEDRIRQEDYDNCWNVLNKIVEKIKDNENKVNKEAEMKRQSKVNAVREEFNNTLKLLEEVWREEE